MNRTLLYVPGDRPDRFEKATASGADAVIVDLEDAVAPGAKDDARAAVREWLATPPSVAVWVRIATLDDFDLVAAGQATGVVVPKATVERCHTSPVPVHALLETAEGVASAHEIAALPGVVRLALGEADLAADLGMEPSPDGRELWAIRTDVVVASARAGIDAPIGPVFTDLDDSAGLTTTSTTLRRQGFGGRGIIHPTQVAGVHAAFTPTDDEVAAARRVIEAHAAAGDGTAVLDGRFVDAAVVRSARRVLDRVPSADQ